jgi:hypothetical protein
MCANYVENGRGREDLRNQRTGLSITRLGSWLKVRCLYNNSHNGRVSLIKAGYSLSVRLSREL